MFHPRRPADAEDKHSIPYLGWYMDPGYVSRRTTGSTNQLSALQSWLDKEMNDISTNHADEVRHDDIAMVIMLDTDIAIQYQPADYYNVPDLPDDKESEDGKSITSAESLSPTKKSPTTGVKEDSIPFRSSNYDPDYKLDIKKRIELAKSLWLCINDKGCLPNPLTFMNDLGEYNLSVSDNKEYKFEEESSYRIAVIFTFRFLTNGGIHLSKDINEHSRYAYECPKRSKNGDKMCPPEHVLPNDITDALFNSLCPTGVKTNSQIPPKTWIRLLDNYMASLVQCRKNKKHLYDMDLTICPWCEMDKRYKEQNSFIKKRILTSYKTIRRNR